MRSVAAQTRTRAALTAYAAGVNARITRSTPRACRGAPSSSFNAPPVPWQPADSIAIVKLMALQLRASSATRSCAPAPRCCCRTKTGSRTSCLTFRRGRCAPPAMPRRSPPEVHAVRRKPLERHPVALPGARPCRASNARGGGVLALGQCGTLLANDPHSASPRLDLVSRPAPACLGRVIGGTIPGVPAVMLGRSEKLAWGITSAYLDDQNLYRGTEPAGSRSTTARLTAGSAS
ncbi:penicillin acylase family protein [Antarctobacter sp.]|uniref:penicillin acylase family protein n=1 Tax=Antarctobacter sp. TaxID=1872577 RepID=UPI003A923E47